MELRIVKMRHLISYTRVVLYIFLLHIPGFLLFANFELETVKVLSGIILFFLWYHLRSHWKLSTAASTSLALFISLGSLAWFSYNSFVNEYQIALPVFVRYFLLVLFILTIIVLSLVRLNEISEYQSKHFIQREESDFIFIDIPGKKVDSELTWARFIHILIFISLPVVWIMMGYNLDNVMLLTGMCIVYLWLGSIDLMEEYDWLFIGIGIFLMISFFIWFELLESWEKKLSSVSTSIEFFIIAIVILLYLISFKVIIEYSGKYEKPKKGSISRKAQIRHDRKMRALEMSFVHPGLSGADLMMAADCAYSMDIEGEDSYNEEHDRFMASHEASKIRK